MGGVGFGVGFVGAISRRKLKKGKERGRKGQTSKKGNGALQKHSKNRETRKKKNRNHKMQKT